MAKRPSKKSAPAAAPEAGALAVAPAVRATGGGGRGGKGRRNFGPPRGTGFTAGKAKDKHLVIVESPAKAKTINKYLGNDYLVLASVGHIRDLPSKNPKGVKSPVPGVDLEHDFKPTYESLPDKEKVVDELRRAAKETLGSGREVWFATDLDREGEAIAWHLAQIVGIKSNQAKRVIFPAITKTDIEKAFKHPHAIDEDRVNAQQARRIVDRIVGYQVSPLLWKKVARGLSAGRVQSVAVRLIVEREREIRAFIPDESWTIHACFTPDLSKGSTLAKEFAEYMARRNERGESPSQKLQNGWLSDNNCLKAELVEIGGNKFDLSAPGKITDLTPKASDILKLLGASAVSATVTENPDGKGPAKFQRTINATVDPQTPYSITSIETKRTTSRPPPPFITSTLQQAGSNALGFAARRTMTAAQQLYQGVEIPGEGPVGLISYMRTDSTHLSGDAINMARDYVGKKYGEKYLPEKPNFFSSSNKDAQEAHEAIRPTSMDYPPSRVKNALTSDQLRLYTLIWDRFVACQMKAAEWDSTAITITGGTDPRKLCSLRATGRVLAFDGFYKVLGVPTGGEEQTLPGLKEKQPLSPFALQPAQKFSNPPPRFTEASLIKTLESEGIGRPSTYADIIQKIQDQKYVESLERRFYATSLGEVVTDKLTEAFPEIMSVGYTRAMEEQLDKVEEEHLDWIDMLHKFYGPFKHALDHAEENLGHAKAETTPAPKEYRCGLCQKDLVYRFGKNGRFLSCSDYPNCKFAQPCDRDGKPQQAAETTQVACPKCTAPMTLRTGRFGPFLGCSRYNDKANPCDGILNLGKGKDANKVVAKSPPPPQTDLPCPTCKSPLNLRNGIRGPWLGCSRFPKCRGRGKWTELDEKTQKHLIDILEKHEKANPTPIVRTLDGKALTESSGKPLPNAPTIEMLSTGLAARKQSDGPETLESVADEIGV
ncbi:MAG: type I DNA topoisomerase [Planctomycetes bacterium]|nr:type I DNA topoisomerase [Planctomycetota bacterium]